MIALAFLAGLWTATRRARREKISGEKHRRHRALAHGRRNHRRTFCLCHDLLARGICRPAGLGNFHAIQHGGLVYYGGLIGATIAGVIYIRWKKLPLWKTADVLAPSIALGNVFGRIGCLLNGCCYGRACNLPWAIRFPADNPLNPPTYPVHPTEIYDALLNLIVYFFLAWLFRRKKFDGQIFATFLLCYAVTRSFVEYFRGDYTNLHYHLGLTPAQWISVPIFVAGLALAAILSRRAPAK
jgi:phosphatidylglycerol:prolipoprotein diacylglycerol transferase